MGRKKQVGEDEFRGRRKAWWVHPPAGSLWLHSLGFAACTLLGCLPVLVACPRSPDCEGLTRLMYL